MMRLSKMPCVLPLVAALVVVFGSHLGSGQAPPPTPDCNNALFTLAPCLDFVSNSSVNTASPLCCGALTNLSTSSPVCLCEFISPDYANQGAALGINATKALELPGLCSLSISVSSCAALLGPATAPGLSPVLAPVLSPPALAPVLVPTPVLAPIIVPPALAPVTIPPPIPTTPVPAASPIPGGETPVTTPSSSPESSVAPGPAEDCQSELVPLLPCLAFLKGTDNTPSKDCCTNLRNVVDTSPTCICSLASSGSTSAIPGINSTRALELPAFCDINVSLSTCTGPSTSPSSFPPAGDDSAFAVKAAIPSLSMAIVCILVVSSIVLLDSNGVDLWPPAFV